MDCTEYTDKLEADGFRLLGGGHFSSVYGRSDLGFVIKIGTKDDLQTHPGHWDGWLPYAQWLAKEQPDNPHYPKVWDVQTFDDFYVAKVERLARPDAVPASVDWHTLHNSARKCMYREGHDTLPQKLEEACKKIVELFGNKYSQDFHEANFMVRPGDQPVMVITDPLSFILDDYAKWLSTTQGDLFAWAGMDLNPSGVDTRF